MGTQEMGREGGGGVIRVATGGHLFLGGQSQTETSDIQVGLHWGSLHGPAERSCMF